MRGSTRANAGRHRRAAVAQLRRVIPPWVEVAPVVQRRAGPGAERVPQAVTARRNHAERDRRELRRQCVGDLLAVHGVGALGVADGSRGPAAPAGGRWTGSSAGSRSCWSRRESSSAGATIGSRSTAVRILFSVRNPSYVRHYESVLRLLAERGHDVLLVTERPERHTWPPSVFALAEAHPRIALSLMPDADRRPLVRTGDATAASALLLAVPGSGLPRHAGAVGARTQPGAPTGDTPRGVAAARPGRTTAAGARALAPSSARRAHRPSSIAIWRAEAGRRGHDAARGAENIAARPGTCCHRARRSQRVRGGQLGQPVQQGRADLRCRSGSSSGTTSRNERPRSCTTSPLSESRSPAPRCSTSGS